jgi:hypothetical protein
LSFFDKLKEFLGVKKKILSLDNLKDIEEYEKYFEPILQKGLLTSKELFKLADKLGAVYHMKPRYARRMICRFCKKNEVIVER